MPGISIDLPKFVAVTKASFVEGVISRHGGMEVRANKMIMGDYARFCGPWADKLMNTIQSNI